MAKTELLMPESPAKVKANGSARASGVGSLANPVRNKLRESRAGGDGALFEPGSLGGAGQGTEVRELLRGARVLGSARKLGRERGLPLAMWKCNESVTNVQRRDMILKNLSSHQSNGLVTRAAM